MEQYAYIRVSTREQNIDRQLAALEPFGISKDHIYCDYQSGKDFNRPAYQKLIQKLHPGDLLIIKSIDRLGRDYDEIMVQWQYITKTLKADVQVLDLELLNTRQKMGDLTGTLIADLVLQIMAYFAQTERETIHQRQAEGIAAARARGQHLGRKPYELPEGFEEACRECMEGKISIRKAAERIGMKRSTFHRYYQKIRKYTNEIVPEGRLLETILVQYNNKNPYLKAGISHHENAILSRLMLCTKKPTF